MKLARLILALIVFMAGTNLPVIAAEIAHKPQATYQPLTSSVGILVTIYPIGGLPFPPTNFTATANNGAIVLAWANGLNATGTYIVRGINGYPALITDGVIIYSGTDVTFTDTSAGNVDASQYYYVAWGYTGAVYSLTSTQTTVGGTGMTLFALLGITAILSLIAVRSEFILLKIAAMGAWFFMFMYVRSNPPYPLVEGSSVQQVLMVVCIAAGIGIGLMAFGRNVSRNRQSSGGGVSGAQWGWKFGKDRDEYEGRVAPHSETVDEYQARVRRALKRDR